MSTAYQTCWKQKTRCSSERPECSTCTENGRSRGGYRDSVRVRKTSPDNTTNVENVVREDTVNLKPSSSNGDGYVPPFRPALPGAIHPQETPRAETGVV